MARLIDYHTNCSCGHDVHTIGDLDDEGRLDVNTRAGFAPGAGQVVDAGAALGESMAPMRPEPDLDELVDAVLGKVKAGMVTIDEVLDKLGACPPGNVLIEEQLDEATQAAVAEAQAPRRGPGRPRKGGGG